VKVVVTDKMLLSACIKVGWASTHDARETVREIVETALKHCEESSSETVGDVLQEMRGAADHGFFNEKEARVTLRQMADRIEAALKGGAK
jgi:hypothetical protein